MEHWLREAKNLAYMGHRKIQCCGPDQSMRIEHGQKGYRAWCFRCKEPKFEPHGQVSLKELSDRRAQVDALLTSKTIELPRDMTYSLPNAHAAWLLRAGIPLAIAKEYGIGYSPKMDRTILPVYREEKLVAYTMRSISERPKYIERQIDETAVFESKASLILEPERCGDYGLDAVVTEDVLSGIRVGRHIPSYALLGTAVGPRKVQSLLELIRPEETSLQGFGYEAPRLRIGIWLDSDKAGVQARKRLETRLTLFGHECVIIKTPLDPKRYSNREIRSILIDRRNPTESSQEP